MKNYFLLLLVIITLIIASCKESTIKPENNNGNMTGHIIYTKLSLDGQQNIIGGQLWCMDMRPQTQTMLYDTTGVVCPPVNGKMLLSPIPTSGSSPGIFLRLANTDGSNLHQIASGSAYSSRKYVISPDFQKIAFAFEAGFVDTGTVHYASDIYVMNIDGSGLIKIFDRAAHETTPVFSPDGSKIAILKESQEQLPGKDSLFIVNSDGSNLHFLSTGIRTTGIYESLDWSPSGDYIVGVKDALVTSDSSEIIKLYVDGRTPVTQKLTTDGQIKMFTVFSPDGSKIASMVFQPSYCYITIIDVNTGVGTNVCSYFKGSGDGFPLKYQWSPDGKYLLFIEITTDVSAPGANGTLKYIEIATKKVKTIAYNVFNAYWVQ